MISVNISQGDISIYNIKENELFRVFRWINDIESFCYATGNDKPISEEDFIRINYKGLNQLNQFFCSVYSNFERDIVGVFKGVIYKPTNKAGFTDN